MLYPVNVNGACVYNLVLFNKKAICYVVEYKAYLLMTLDIFF